MKKLIADMAYLTGLYFGFLRAAFVEGSKDGWSKHYDEILLPEYQAKRNALNS